MAEEEETPKPKARKRGERISLYPLTFMEAVRGLLKVAPKERRKEGEGEAREEAPRGQG